MTADETDQSQHGLFERPEDDALDDTPDPREAILDGDALPGDVMTEYEVVSIEAEQEAQEHDDRHQALAERTDELESDDPDDLNDPPVGPLPIVRHETTGEEQATGERLAYRHHRAVDLPPQR